MCGKSWPPDSPHKLQTAAQAVSRGTLQAAVGPKESGGLAAAEVLARHLLLQSRKPAEFLDDALPHYRDITRFANPQTPLWWEHVFQRCQKACTGPGEDCQQEVIYI